MKPVSESFLLRRLEVHLLGVVDFDAAMFLQERLLYEISGREDACGAVILCEHPPLITIGREGSRGALTTDPETLERMRLPVRWINRGGGCVVHAPGQLAIYPILPLRRLGLGLVEYRTRLETAVIRACEELQTPASRHEEIPGVWGRAGQLAEIGVGIKRWVSMHGVFVNVCPHPAMVAIARPSAGEAATTLAAQQTRRFPMPSFREAVSRHLAEVLGYEETCYVTGSPLLRRTRQVVPVFGSKDEA